MTAKKAPNPVVLVMSGPILRDDVRRLCERVRMLLEHSDGDLVICDSDALDDPDAVTVDFLARLQLTARRLGRRVRLLDACGELQDLLELTGLSEVVPTSAGLPLQARGQPEQREPAGGVEEEADPADPIA
jgi:ABC-type transporter Mla MlaB component